MYLDELFNWVLRLVGIFVAMVVVFGMVFVGIETPLGWFEMDFLKAITYIPFWYIYFFCFSMGLGLFFIIRVTYWCFPTISKDKYGVKVNFVELERDDKWDLALGLTNLLTPLYIFLMYFLIC